MARIKRALSECIFTLAGESGAEPGTQEFECSGSWVMSVYERSELVTCD